MTKEEFIGKLRSIYVGEENAIDEIISEYDRLNNIIKELESYLLDCDESKVIISSKGVYYKNIDILDKLKELKKGDK